MFERHHTTVYRYSVILTNEEGLARINLRR